MILGLTLNPGHVYPLDAKPDEEIQFSMAALEIQEDNDVKTKYMKIMVHTESEQYLLCTLVHGMILQQSLDLKLQPNEKLSFSVSGEGKVHITGYSVGIQSEFVHSADVVNEDNGMYEYDESMMADWTKDESSEYDNAEGMSTQKDQLHVVNAPAQITDPLFKEGCHSLSAQKSKTQRSQFDKTRRGPVVSPVIVEDPDIIEVKEEAGPSDWIDDSKGGSNSQLNLDQPHEDTSQSNSSEALQTTPPIMVYGSLSQGEEAVTWNQIGNAMQYQDSFANSQTNGTKNKHSNRSKTGTSHIPAFKGENPSMQLDSVTFSSSDLRNSNGRYMCQFCGKDFGSGSNLKIHIRSHTGHKPFVCKHCGKAFSHISNCRRHERIHIVVKSFNCRYCSQTFSQVSQRDQHQMSHEASPAGQHAILPPTLP